MFNTIKSIFSFIKARLTLVLLGLVLFLGIAVNMQQNMIRSKDGEIGVLNNNLIEYSSTVNGLSAEKRVLKLKISDLSNSNDKAIRTIDSLNKVLKIKPKTIKSVSIVETQIHDTLQAKVDSVYKDFDTTLKPNNLTTIRVIRKDTLLTVIPTILNEQVVWIREEKVYRNKRKGWFDRLIHLDYKKDIIEKYHVVNTNDMVKIKNVKVIRL